MPNTTFNTKPAHGDVQPSDAPEGPTQKQKPFSSRRVLSHLAANCLGSSPRPKPWVTTHSPLSPRSRRQGSEDLSYYYYFFSHRQKPLLPLVTPVAFASLLHISHPRLRSSASTELWALRSGCSQSPRHDPWKGTLPAAEPPVKDVNWLLWPFL